ncbi:hypothetical protein N9J72_02365 [Candidatus Gracilibacteria bacterium]|nr:hypothetical protein [Candidatus Gracilibacteria bacterium]
MFENITQTYTFTDASIEISVMLFGAFLLGAIIGWLLKPRKYIVQKVVSASALTGVTSYSASKKSDQENVSTSQVTEEVPGVVPVVGATKVVGVEKIEETPKVKQEKTPKDNLQMIEGVGPKIEKLMNKHGVRSFGDMVSSDVTGLEDILLAGGPRYQVHSPTTWPDQARLAMQGKWSELEEYQAILNRGQE